MKSLRYAVGIVWALAALAQQTSDTELKHITASPASGERTVTLSAREIERGPHYPSVIRLREKVEIKTPICMTVDSEGEVCDGYMILRADEATYHEDTGKIEASGNVSVLPHEHVK